MTVPVWLQRLIPQHALSRTLGRLARARQPLVKNALIDTFARAYRVDLGEAARKSAHEFASFNDFFTRELAPAVRPLPDDRDALLSPCDGTVSQAGAISGDTLVQAKGKTYSLAQLLGDADWAGTFDGGSFVTIYLAPRDYHRVHAPCSGVVRRSIAIPGTLFSVNAATEAGLDGLFCRNERLVIELVSAHGRIAVVMVGALIVASIETVFGAARSPYVARIERPHDVAIEAGAELGRFLLGSTVIVVVPRGAATLADDVVPARRVRLREALGVTDAAILGRRTPSPQHED